MKVERPRQCLKAAREADSTPERVGELITEFQRLMLEMANRWDDPPAVLYRRIEGDNPKLDVSTGWPKPNIDAKRKVNQAKKREADNCARAEFEKEKRQAETDNARLNTRYAAQWDALDESERLRIAGRLLGEALKPIRKQSALIRDQVFIEAYALNIDRLSDLLDTAGGNAA